MLIVSKFKPLYTYILFVCIISISFISLLSSNKLALSNVCIYPATTETWHIRQIMFKLEVMDTHSTQPNIGKRKIAY